MVWMRIFTQGKLVVNEVHSQDIVRPSGLLAVFSELCLHPALRVLVSEFQAQLVVNTVGFLDFVMIHLSRLRSAWTRL